MSEAEADLREQYLVAAKVAGLGLGRVDYTDDTITLDPRAAEIFDLPTDVAIARAQLHDRIHPEDRAKIDYQVSALLNPAGDDYIDVQHRVVHDNGDVLWVNARKQVTFETTAEGLVPMRGVVSIMDISAYKAAQDHNAVLMDELNHRSKNLLAVVMGLVRSTLRTGPPETFEQRLSPRLNGLIRNADTLSKEAWQHADLNDIAVSQLSAFVSPTGDRLHLNGPPAKLTGSAAQSVGMAFHELATNAVKYGALSTDTGRIEVTWGPKTAAPDVFELIWIERDGPRIEAPTTAGFGKSVTTDLVAASVSGEVEITYPPEGLMWRLTMPMAELV